MKKVKIKKAKSKEDSEADQLYTFEDYKETKPKEKKVEKPIKKPIKKGLDRKRQDRLAYGRAYNLLKKYGCFYADPHWCDNSGLPIGGTVIEAASTLKKWKKI